MCCKYKIGFEIYKTLERNISHSCIGGYFSRLLTGQVILISNTTGYYYWLKPPLYKGVNRITMLLHQWRLFK